jgi:murein DD-endopeptidase MepM/ murein hydrolase activator NlpD
LNARWLLLAASSLVLVAAARPEPPAAPRPAEPDSPPIVSMGAYDWLRILPAPTTPASFQPAAGPRVAWPLIGVLTQPFGCTGFYRETPASDCPEGFHTGIDIARPQGIPITAAAAGIAYPIADPERYGNHVLIQHQGGLATIYAHMVGFAVVWGQAVQKGQVIGYVGSTGNSTGPHLHFEVRFGGVPRDPMPYLEGSPPDPEALLEGWPGSPRDDLRGRR